MNNSMIGNSRNRRDKDAEAADYLYQSAIEIAPVIIWIADVDRRCIYQNKRWHDYTGQTVENSLGLGWVNAVHPDDVEPYRSEFIRANKRQTPFSFEYRLRDKYGNYRWHLNSGRPKVDEEGNFDGFVGSAVDIHARKEAEEALRTSERYYKTYAEAMPQMAFAADSKGNIIYYNQRWYDYINGMEGTEGWGWKDKPIHHPDDLQTTLERWNRSLETEEPYEVEYRLRRYDGEYRWHLGRAMPVRDKEGRIEMWIGTNTDIHKYKMEAEVAKQKEQRLRTATSAAELGVFEWDIRGDGTLWENERMYTLFGGAREQETIPDAGFPEKMLYKEDVDRFHVALSAAMKERRNFQIECRILRSDNAELRWVEWFGKFEYDPDNKPVKLVGVIKDITERKLTEENLKEKDRLYRMLVSNLPNGAAFILDKNLRYILANGPAIEMAGYKHTQLEGRTIREALETEVVEFVEPFYLSALEGKTSSFYYTVNNHHFKTAVVPIYNSYGEINAILAVSYDVTDRKILEDQLQNERELLQTIFDKIPVMLSIYDPNIRVNHLNKALERITGWTVEDYSERSIMELAYPDPEYRRMVSEYMASLSPGFKDIKMTAKSGEIIETSWANVRISDGRNVGIGIDISERKASERKMAGLSKQLQAVVDNIKDGVVVYRPDGTILEMNKAARHIVSLLTRDGEGYEEVSLYYPDGGLVSRDEWPKNRCLKGEDFTRVEYCTTNTVNKNTLYLEYSGIPVYENNRLLLAVVTVHDVTERKKTLLQIAEANDGLKSKNAQLEKLNQLHENLLYIIAHDLKNPISNISLIVELLRRDPEESEKEGLLNNLSDMISRQESILNGLVELIEAQSREDDTTKAIDLAALTRDIVKDNEATLTACGGAVHFDFQEVPAINYIHTFALSILKNLIANAIKYRDESRRLAIHIHSARSGDYAVVSVRDNGIGIDLEKHGKNMFRPFRRFSDQASGTGIGLYIIKHLIEKNGGYIKVESQPGKGSCFHCYFKEY